jgi:hypothetical protein
MNEFFVEVERDSVCMGDDIDAPHSYIFKVPAHATLNEIFEHLARISYLATVAGRDHSWEAISGNKSLALFKGNNLQPEPSGTLSNSVSEYVSNGRLNIHFKYNSAAT